MEEGKLVVVIIIILIIMAAAVVYKDVKSLWEKTLNIGIFGFLYDEEQNVFYTAKDAWQRKFGYCQLYDEGAPLSGMIIDCEPIYFEYDDKRWMIEFWKGQYGACTGCEIGIYVSIFSGLQLPDKIQPEDEVYRCANDSEMLDISASLYKNNRLLFYRKEVHWWLTGFLLGQFSETEELMVHSEIKFKDPDMCRAFAEGLKRAGYSERDYKASGTIAFVQFGKPHTKQPETRTKKIEAQVQEQNKLVCRAITEVTEGVTGVQNKIDMLQVKEPALYRQLKKSVRPKGVYKGAKLIEQKVKKQIKEVK